MDFSKSDLPFGPSNFQVLNQEGDVLSGLTFYNDWNEAIVDIKVNDTVITHEATALDFYLHDEDGNPLTGEFSVSVINETLFSDDLIGLRTEWLNKQTLDSFSHNQKLNSENHLMLRSHSVSDGYWKKIRENNFPLFGSIEKSGRVIYQDTRKPLEKGTQLMIYLQKSKYFLHTTIGPNGRVRFALPDVFESDEIYFMAYDHTRKQEIRNFELSWDSIGFEISPSPKFEQQKEADMYATYSRKVRLVNQSYSVFKYSSDFEYSSDEVELNEFEELIKRPDVSILMKDYITFPTMAEFIQEVIKPMYYRKRKNEERVRVYLQEPMKASSDPVYIIDNIATRNSGFFLSLGPNEIVSIKIINNPIKLKPLGLLGRNGIVIINTKAGNKRVGEIDNANRIDGLSRPMGFTFPDKFSPVFRSTVYWNPSIFTEGGKASVQFPFSDDTAEYRIEVKGITTDGKVFSSQAKIYPVIKFIQE